MRSSFKFRESRTLKNQRGGGGHVSRSMAVKIRRELKTMPLAFVVNEVNSIADFLSRLK